MAPCRRFSKRCPLMDVANKRHTRFRRFRINQLMPVVAGVAVACALFRAGAIIAVNALYVLALAAIAWLPSRGHPGVAIRGFILSAAWVNLTLPVFFAFQPVFHKWMLWLAAALICLPLAFGCGLAWAASRPDRRGRIRAGVVLAVLKAGPIATIATD
jgi:hypothetical protein